MESLGSLDEGGNETLDITLDNQFGNNEQLSFVEITVGIIDVLTEETWCVWVSLVGFPTIGSFRCLLLL